MDGQTCAIGAKDHITFSKATTHPDQQCTTRGTGTQQGNKAAMQNIDGTSRGLRHEEKRQHERQHGSDERMLSLERSRTVGSHASGQALEPQDAADKRPGRL